LLRPARAESGRFAAAAGHIKVKTPLANKGAAWRPKMYCEGDGILDELMNFPGLKSNFEASFNNMRKGIEGRG
jgi:hypothetical protein